MSLKSNKGFNAKVRKFHWLLGKLNLRGRKADLLANYDVTSTSDLSYDQLVELVQTLEKEVPSEAPKHIRKWRSVNIDLLSKLGLYQDSKDWPRVNAYLMEPRIAGKLLFQMDEMELKTLATKLRAVLRKKEAEAKENAYQALNN